MKQNKKAAVILFLAIAGFYFYLQTDWLEKEQDPVFLSANTLKQGDTLFIGIGTPLSERGITGEFDSQKLDFFQIEDSKIKAAILGIDAKEKPGEHILILNFSNGERIERKINVSKTEFPTTELLVTKELQKKGYTPEKIIKNIQSKEGPLLIKILGVYTPGTYFNKAFIAPLKDVKIVGAFGTIKKTGSSTVQHLGVDLEAKIGTPVFASNDGKVSFSQGLPNYGKTLILDHGLGIFSLYLHLNEFKTFEGKSVKQGEVIGLSGNTGYSIAPHLHFSIKANGASVDPLIFLETTQKGLNMR